MMIALAFSLGLFLSLWPYFIYLGAFEFKNNPNTPETPLDGRPSRRTIGRKNEDMMKAIFTITAFYILFYFLFYWGINDRFLLGQALLLLVIAGGGVMSFYSVALSNRLVHAYLSLGQITVIHLVCGVSVFIALSVVFSGFALSVPQMQALAALVIGAMLMFSKRLGRDA